MSELNNLSRVKRFDFCGEEEFGIREEPNGEYIFYSDAEDMVPQWRDAKDRLPESGIEVIVNRKNNGFWWGVWHGDIWLVRYANGWTDKADVTHWMPLPNPPEATK